MAKKLVLTEPPPAVEDRKVRILVRVARMLKMRKESPTAETDTYDSSIRDYQYLWSKLSPEDRARVEEAAASIDDITQEDIDAALAVLGH